jgi:hypothetical protein
LISRNDKWKDLSNEEKSKSVTKLFDTVDSSVFEKTIMNKKRTEGQNNFLINTDNIRKFFLFINLKININFYQLINLTCFKK